MASQSSGRSLYRTTCGSTVPVSRLSIWPAIVRVGAENIGFSGMPAGVPGRLWVTMNGIRMLLSGRGLLESPRWHGDRLYFSDWSAGEVVAVDLAGRSEVIAREASLPLCTAWLPDGRLVIVSSAGGRLLRREPGGSLVTHANLGQPGWNDIVADGRGNIYVNRAGFNPVAGEEVQPGFVFLVAGDGSVRQVAGDIEFPNGMAV